jgi:hypothetical protein
LVFLDLLPQIDCVGRHNVPAEHSIAWERGRYPAKINIFDRPGLMDRFSRCGLETCVDAPASRRILSPARRQKVCGISRDGGTPGNLRIKAIPG